MEMRKLQELAVAALEDIKGKNIEVIDTRGLSPSMFDRDDHLPPRLQPPGPGAGPQRA
jgi:hypothetical protein